jgi:hypothetical protein
MAKYAGRGGQATAKCEGEGVPLNGLLSVASLCDIGNTLPAGPALGGASGALAPGANFEGAPKRRSPTGHTLIRSTVAW